MRIKIFEVGPRDGLQNEVKILSLEQKKHFIELLSQAGHSDIEVGAFVNPQKIPQMANTKELTKALGKSLKTQYWNLVPNDRGFQDAAESGVKNIAIFTAASETFNQRNINTSIDGSFERFETFLPNAKKLKMRIRGYVSTCFGCPYEGVINPKAVLKVTERLLKLGVHEISIGDTIGVANPKQVEKLTKSLLKLMGSKKLALHFHDTRGTALANILAGLQAGVKIFDSSSGGLGGCPYAPGAAGNVATEDLLYMLHEMGFDTGINLAKQVQASQYVQSCLNRTLPSRYLQAATKNSTNS
ncbi:MAG: hydroxymethylglutaryl-CoA lyase [Oligoflexia bacterium]|nr:hydroxymethylglutaryl-CoA lyase [Oligoflexia bacterium]